MKPWWKPSNSGGDPEVLAEIAAPRHSSYDVEITNTATGESNRLRLEQDVTLGGQQENGDNSFVWDGKDQAGNLAPPGTYFFEITARSGRAEARLQVPFTIPASSATAPKAETPASSPGR
jgi:flagellar hook assembly protein FlgD